MRPLALIFTACLLACSSQPDDFTCTLVGCGNSGVVLPIESTAKAGEITACIGGTCAKGTFGDGSYTTIHLDADGRSAIAFVTADGANVRVQFEFGSPPPEDGVVFRATLTEFGSSASTTVKTDPVQWNVSYPNGAACGPACVTPKNLVVNPA